MADLGNWARILHIVGIVLWVGGLLSVSLILSRIEDKHSIQERSNIAALLERSLSLPGFVLTLVGGLYMLLIQEIPYQPIKQPWMHIKLTLVFILIGLQGMLGASRKKLRTTEDHAGLRGRFSLVFLLTFAIALASVVLVEARPLDRTNKILLESVKAKLTN